MRTFYLFHVKTEILDIYDKKPERLYQMLENLYRMKKKQFYYGVSLYMQLCQVFDTSLFQRYFKGNKHYQKKKNKYYFSGKENFMVVLKPSSLIVKTVTNVPSIFKLFHYYDKNIFVCDFESQDFFFLKNQYHPKQLQRVKN